MRHVGRDVGSCKTAAHLNLGAGIVLERDYFCQARHFVVTFTWLRLYFGYLVFGKTVQIRRYPVAVSAEILTCC